MSPTFPRDDDLCERCGYPLKGVAADAICPECGTPVSQSDPARRAGLAWQRRRTLGAWLLTMRDVLLRPRAAFDQIILPAADPVATPASGRRVGLTFLLTITALVSVLWACIGAVGLPRQPVRFGLIAGVLVILLSYIEIAGVAFWSRRKGLRVTWAVSQLVVVYAAAAWVPAALVVAKAWLLRQYFFVGKAWWIGRWSQTILGPDLTYLIVVSAIAAFWFECLVWYGVRTLRYANRPHAPAPSLDIKAV